MMRLNNLLFSALLLLFGGCSTSENKKLKGGSWVGTLSLNDSTDLVFEFKVVPTGDTIKIINAEETITVDEISINKDSVRIKMPVFDSEFNCAMQGDSLTRNWVNHARRDKNII